MPPTECAAPRTETAASRANKRARTRSSSTPDICTHAQRQLLHVSETSLVREARARGDVLDLDQWRLDAVRRAAFFECAEITCTSHVGSAGDGIAGGVTSGAVPVAYSAVLGAEDAKYLLESEVALPLRASALTVGLTRAHTMLHLCGRAGSGKATLVLAFCVHYGIRLVRIGTLRASPRVFEDAVAYAVRNEPCIVLLDNSDLYFSRAAPMNDYCNALYNAYMHDVVRRGPRRGRGSETWVVLATEAAPQELEERFYARVLRHSVWIGEMSDDRRSIFIAETVADQISAMGVAAHVDESYCREVANAVTDAARYYTPREIRAFLAHVFCRRLRTALLPTLPVDSDGHFSADDDTAPVVNLSSCVPSLRDFRDALVIDGRTAQHRLTSAERTSEAARYVSRTRHGAVHMASSTLGATGQGRSSTDNSQFLRGLGM